MKIRSSIAVCFILFATIATHAPTMRAADQPPMQNAVHAVVSADASAAPRFRDVSPGHIPGIVRPAARVTLSAPLEGVLMQVLVKEGQNVKEGEIVAVMDNRVAKASVALAQASATRNADLDHVRHEMRLAEKVLQRETSLAAKKAITAHQLDEAKTRYDIAKSDVARVQEVQLQATAALLLEQAKLESCNIRAPFSGQIVQIHEFAGATMTQQSKLLTLASMATLEAELHLPVKLYGVLKPGQQYRLVADQPVGGSLNATLKYVAPMIDSASMSFRCVFVIPNDDLHLPAGIAVKFDAESLKIEGNAVKPGQGS